MENTSFNQTWDANLYQSRHDFVWKFGENLISLLNPQPGELILDLGCGSGQLTAKIAESGATVMGIDNSREMILAAQTNYPHISFSVDDASQFCLEQPVDAVFSNATLHWVREVDEAIACIAKALKPGGRFVAEFGGKGNVQAIRDALDAALGNIGLQIPSPWYFPSIGEYASKLEPQGLEVNYAVLFDRPTCLQDGNAGIANWIRMFAGTYLQELTQEIQNQLITSIATRLKPILYRDGNWFADYRRIRIVAIKNA